MRFILGLTLASIFLAKLASSEYVRGCYFANWGTYRPDKGKHTPKDVPATLCTHIFYAFAVMDSGFNLIPFDTWSDLELDGTGYYKQITDLKKSNPSLKVLISFGGWTFSQGNMRLLESMASNAQNRQKFVKSVVAFMKKYNFDGFDVDWEYPSAAIKTAYAQLINELRTEFDRNTPRFLLTAAVPAGLPTIDAGFDVPALAKAFDYLMIMTYDMQDGSRTSFNAPLYDRNNNKLSVKTASEYWNSKGMPKSKIVVGLGAYGRGFSLQSTSNTGVGAPASPSTGLPYSVEGGMAFYYEICDLLSSGGKRYWDETQQVPYVVKGNLWYGYDDPESIAKKLQYVKSSGFGGAFVWALYEDDFNGKSCGGVKYPISSKMNEILGNGSTPATEKPQPQTTQKPGVTTNSPQQPTQKPGGKFQCPAVGFYADPQNCSKYYQCVDANTPVSMNCPAGLNYNAAGKYCDWPANVSCNSG